jgi:hypothetical protein
MDLNAGMLRRMDYVRDQEGIMKRYLAEGKGWEKHLENSRSFIKDSFEGPSSSSVYILGSGWLLDVPMKALLNRFQRVCLVDIRHPVQVRKKWQDHPAVEFLNADLSGGALKQVWDFSRRRPSPSLDALLDNLCLEEPLKDRSMDAIISLNLLSQLDSILVDYLGKKGYTDEVALKELRSRIQSFHIEWIFSRSACLISDVRELYTDREGLESSKDLLSVPWPEGKRNRQWTWAFDSREMYLRGKQTRMEVRAVERT